MTHYTPTHYAIGLVPDNAEPVDNLTFNQSKQALIAFMRDRATPTGWHSEDPSQGWFVIDVKDPALLDELESQSFVDYFPVPGIYPEITQAKDLTIHPLCCEPGLSV